MNLVETDFLAHFSVAKMNLSADDSLNAELLPSRDLPALYKCRYLSSRASVLTCINALHWPLDTLLFPRVFPLWVGARLPRWAVMLISPRAPHACCRSGCTLLTSPHCTSGCSECTAFTLRHFSWTCFTKDFSNERFPVGSDLLICYELWCSSVLVFCYTLIFLYSKSLYRAVYLLWSELHWTLSMAASFAS